MTANYASGTKRGTSESTHPVRVDLPSDFGGPSSSFGANTTQLATELTRYGGVAVAKDISGFPGEAPRVAEPDPNQNASNPLAIEPQAVMAIGSSAGGLEACSALLEKMPAAHSLALILCSISIPGTGA